MVPPWLVLLDTVRAVDCWATKAKKADIKGQDFIFPLLSFLTFVMYVPARFRFLSDYSRIQILGQQVRKIISTQKQASGQHWEKNIKLYPKSLYNFSFAALFFGSFYSSEASNQFFYFLRSSRVITSFCLHALFTARNFHFPPSGELWRNGESITS